MSKKENTPFVIDFKQRKQGNYGTNVHDDNSSSSGSGNNNNRDVPTTPSQLYCLHGQKPIEVRDHCHRQRSEGVDVKARKKLIIASVLCLLFMICEIVGGVLSNSLAIATDAAHLLTDFASFMISLFAIWIAGRPSTQRMSFGWYRAEVIGALASVVMIWFITAILVWLAIERLITREFEVDAQIMLITSGLAILVNLIMGFQLQHGHSHGMISGHGHSHGGDSKKKQKALEMDLARTITLQQAAKAAAGPPPLICAHEDSCVCPTPHTLTGLATHIPPSTAPLDTYHSAPICPASPTERIEDGVTDLAEVDAEMPAAGLRTYSYQNSTSITDGKAEISAVLAETAPGGHHHGGEARREAVNLNVRAAFIHVVGDVIQSIGVFIAALMIYFRPDWSIVDPICTFIFSVIVLITTFAIMKDALLVLMEGTPSYMHYTEVLSIFKQIEGVERVHNLRIWALSINKIALSVHLAIASNADAKRILADATTAVHLRYNFFETTIQIEEFTPQMESCDQCIVPKP